MYKRVAIQFEDAESEFFPALCSVVLGCGKFESEDENLNKEDFTLHH